MRKIFLNRWMKTCLRELCRIKGLDYTKIDFNKKDWNKDYAWTLEQKRTFRVWMVNKFLENDDWRTIANLENNKDLIEGHVDYFLLNYGYHIN